MIKFLDKLLSPKKETLINSEVIQKEFKDDEEVSICVTKDGIITFDLTELNKGLGKIQRVKDPIALLCVNDFCRPIDGNYKNSFDYQHNFDGVIILDAWDEEANIPEIKNNLLN